MLKRYFIKRLVFFLVGGLFIWGLTSCNKYIESSIDELYIDSEFPQNEEFAISYDTPSCYQNNNNEYELHISFKLLNKLYTTQKYKISDFIIIRNKTNASYSVTTNLFYSVLEIDGELSNSFTFRAVLPSSINDEEYDLKFKINSNEFLIHLWEMPDELREDEMVSYYVDGELVSTQTVKWKRTIRDSFLYETKNNEYYCNTWYKDEKCSNMFSFSTLITENISLYGKKRSSLNWATSSSDVYSFLYGINHIPSNKILVIPSTYLNKEICIGNYAIRNMILSKIYIPITVHKIYNGNFYGIGNATIHYEGNEKEWKKLFFLEGDIITKNVIFNSKYDN